MKRQVTRVVTILALAAVGKAGADHGQWHGHPETERHHYGKVLEVKPRYEPVRVTAPSRHCRDAAVPHRVDADRPLAGAVVGGVLGGLMGSQIGRGDGRVAATVIGTAIGALAGYRIGDHLANDADQGAPGRQRCETPQRTVVEEALVGYRVKYRYRGRTYQTETDYHPGDRIPVDLGLRPMYF